MSCDVVFKDKGTQDFVRKLIKDVYGITEPERLKVKDAGSVQELFMGRYKRRLIEARTRERVGRGLEAVNNDLGAAGAYFEAGVLYATAALASAMGMLGAQRTREVASRALTNLLNTKKIIEREGKDKIDTRYGRIGMKEINYLVERAIEQFDLNSQDAKKAAKRSAGNEP